MEQREVPARITGGFWRSWQDLVGRKVIPHQWRAMNDQIPGAPKSHSVNNFRVAAGRAPGTHEGMVFQDSDLAKWMEAAGNVIRFGIPAPAELRAWAEQTMDLVAAAQQPDGYLNTYFTLKEPDRRWGNLRDAHELYCAGHLIEACVSLSRATDDGRILSVARRLADHIDSRFGVEPGKMRGVPGHEEIELALVRLYRLTGERRYLDRARYFIDERGRKPAWFEVETERPGYRSVFGPMPLEYYQAHLPVREQPEATGHAVRALYLACGMADVALETADASLAAQCDLLWDDVTGRKLYVTGGVGAAAAHEAFAGPFDLPNDSAYAETCAAIGLFLFAGRMARLRGGARFADVMERCLHNGILSGLSLDGEGYFYVNPLEVDPRAAAANPSLRHVKGRRQPWYGCACCPPNIARTLTSVGDWAWRRDGGTLYAELYHEGTAAAAIGGASVTVREATRYPWDGAVAITVAAAAPASFTLALRVPGWCRGASLSVNGKRWGREPDADGYLRVERTWGTADRVELELAMEPFTVRADPRVRADYGRVAVQRGPLVYCLEEADNGADLHRAALPPRARLRAVERPDLLGGLTVIAADGVEAVPLPLTGLYAAGRRPARTRRRPLLFIPYYAWANRAPGEMTVWVRDQA
jgi:uncharacterized protein